MEQDNPRKGVQRMMPHRKRFAVVLGVMMFAICVPVAGASASLDNGPCATGDTPSQQGATGGTTNSICQGSGVVFVAPSVGQVATVMGPTIIGPSNVGTVVVSAGDVAAAP
jgi:hypothetical protein